MTETRPFVSGVKFQIMSLGVTAKKEKLILGTMRTEPIFPTLPPYTFCSVRITAKMSTFLRPQFFLKIELVLFAMLIKCKNTIEYYFETNIILSSKGEV